MGFLGLLESGRIKPSTYDVPTNEKPVVWFSANPVMEFTIREFAFERADGTYLRSKTAAEYRIMGMGLFRVAVSATQVLRYVDLLKAAKIGLTRRRQLETIARKVGANPFEWYGRVEPLILDDALGMEIYDGARWLHLPKEGASARALKEQEVTMGELKTLLESGRRDQAPSKAERLF